MLNVLVTGANGFIGRYCLKGLGDICNVLGFNHNALDVTNFDDFLRIKNISVDAVVHTAGLLSIDIGKYTPGDYFRVNLGGTYNVCEFCRRNDVGVIVFMMTHSDVNCSDSLLISEDTPRCFGGPAVPYVVSKTASLDMIESYSREYGIRSVSLRLPGVRGYGSRDSFYGCVFHQFIKKAIGSDPIEIWGGHKTVRDFVYVKDVVRAIGLVLSNTNAYGLYNISMGRGYTIEDEAKAIIKVFSPDGNPSELVYRPDIPEVRTRSYVFDISKAHNDFGFHPLFFYEDALRDIKKEMEKEQGKIK